MTCRLLPRGAAIALALACAVPAFARAPHRPVVHHRAAAPHAIVAPNGVFLSPGDSWREVADAPPSPPLGPASPPHGLGGTFPSVAAAHGAPTKPVEPVTGNLYGSPPLGPEGRTGGTLPSAEPGWSRHS